MIPFQSFQFLFLTDTSLLLSLNEQIKHIELYVNNFVDASLCLLLDKKNPTFYCKDIKPSKFIIKKIKDEYNECMIID